MVGYVLALSTRAANAATSSASRFRSRPAARQERDTGEQISGDDDDQQREASAERPQRDAARERGTRDRAQRRA
jgi:hypothetical protein